VQDTIYFVPIFLFVNSIYVVYNFGFQRIICIKNAMESHFAVLPIKFCHANSGHDSWQLLNHGLTTFFNWENVLLDHLLEILVDGQNTLVFYQIQH
jgi:hypothetical protein